MHHNARSFSVIGPKHPNPDQLNWAQNPTIRPASSPNTYIAQFVLKLQICPSPGAANFPVAHSFTASLSSPKNLAKP